MKGRLVTKAIMFVCVLAVGFVFVSCGGSGKKEAANTKAAPMAMMRSEAVSYETNNFVGSVDNSAVVMGEDSYSTDGQDVSGQTERKLVKTASLSFKVKTLSDAEIKTNELVQKYNGYIADSWTSRNSSSFTVKIPAVSFDSAMESTNTFGVLESRSISTEDVSEQFYDLSTRLETRKLLQKKLQEYLKTAENTSDLLEIEAQLNDVQTDIESMEGRFRRLNNRIDYSTITLNYELPSYTTEEGPELPDFVENLVQLGSNALYYLSGIAIFLLYVVIFGIPTILVAALLWWLSFGKIGLVRKLFVRLTKGKKEK